jgi:hypothetical protein
MHNLFRPKPLAFYGGSIALVIALFSFVTAYGEKNLKAPNRVDGRYPITETGLPGCLQAKALALTVQQSGIFLTGALLPSDAPEKVVRIAQERPPLVGRWQNQQIVLQGSVPDVPDCQGQISIQADSTNNILSGTLQFDSVPGKATFSSQRQVPQGSSKEHS